MQSGGVAPGEASRVPCPQCGGLVHFTTAGGPHLLRCQVCGLAISLDVVHDGKRWTVRRVRRSAKPPPSGPS